MIPEDMPSLRGVKLISPMQSANTILAGEPGLPELAPGMVSAGFVCHMRFGS